MNEGISNTERSTGRNFVASLNAKQLHIVEAMSFILDAVAGGDVQINAWHWRPTMQLVRRAVTLDDERFEQLHINGVGASVSATEAQSIAQFLDKFLAEFPEDGCLHMDGSITREQRSGHTTDRAWLVQFREFCRSSGGFKIV